MARLKFEDLNSAHLAQLRGEIVLNSLFTNDYNNSFGFAPKSVQSFFDGYMEYLWELAKEDYTEDELDELDAFDSVNEYDDVDTLFDYYWNCDDYSWFEYDPAFTEEDEREYERKWNG